MRLRQFFFKCYLSYFVYFFKISPGTYGRHFEVLELRGGGNASASGMRARRRLWERTIKLESNASTEEDLGFLPTITLPSQKRHGRALGGLRADATF